MSSKRIKIRKAWSINPKTRIKDSKKIYSRKTKRRKAQDEIKAWAAEG